MKVVFADTGFLLGLLHRKDHLHEMALALAKEHEQSRIITSEFVISELLAAVARLGEPIRVAAVQLTRKLEENPNHLLEPATALLFREALELYEHRRDKSYSHVDCTSFVLMRRHDITEALAHDEHFEQEGYIALMR